MSDVTASQTAGRITLPRLHDIAAVFKRGDLMLAFGVLTILVVLILPLPPIVLDLFLAISITISILILMTALFIHTPLEFSAFPTVLLIATMLRLALNLASTRLILSHGHEGTAAAGHVIEAFGNFVMSGNFVIGIIVFTILVIVNFVVITKGSGRIAEVAARFHLDAMPGKQMAIDADLSAGLIDEQQARKRRRELEDESGFLISSAVIRISTESVIEIDSMKSSRKGGRGTMSMTTSAMTPRPRAYSPLANCLVSEFQSNPPLTNVAAPACAIYAIPKFD